MTTQEPTTHKGTATYSPEDNKLRFYPFERLSPTDYGIIKAHGFIWAPRQELFVSPMWTPDRESLMSEWCGEVGDEDTSLVERAEERAERFEGYSENRAQDAERAKDAVSAIADHIPLGQPILVGHHSEKRARRDAEKVENGMRRAVKMWETSKYWTDRARGAIRHAKYKERPDVRVRRIKGLRAEQRRSERTVKEYAHVLKFWRGELFLTHKVTGFKKPYEVTHENAIRFEGSSGTHLSYEFKLAEYPRQLPASQYEGAMSLWSALGGSNGPTHAVCTVDQAKALALATCERVIARAQRWIAHIENRLAYENAMLNENGGLITDRVALGVGGRVLVGGDWHIITKLNGGAEGKPVSVSVPSYWRAIQVEEIAEYQPPAEGDFEKVKAATKLPPICNYPGKCRVARLRSQDADEAPQDIIATTQKEWDEQGTDYKATRIVEATDTVGRHRVRYMLTTGHHYAPVYITDAKRKDPPGPDAVPVERLPRKTPDPRREPRPYVPPARTEFDDMRDSLKHGVKVVSAPQLFPTPPDLAAQLIELADIQPGHEVLEPSAGTGALLDPLFNAEGTSWNGDGGRLVAVEINLDLAHALAREYAVADVRRGDFLTFNGDLGTFDRVLMNPPFKDGADIQHILHALHMLKPGGKLAAICANGPRQNEKLKPLASEWIDLPAGSFYESGTNVNAAMLLICK